MENLTLEWTNDHANTDQSNSLWKFMWQKYGTCLAASLNSLDTEYKYFAQALKWHQNYPIYQYLSEQGIVPMSNVDPWKVMQAIQMGLKGPSPSLKCQYYADFDNVILSQVRLCFDKSLRLIDCNEVMTIAERLGDCTKSSVVFYPRDEKNFRHIERAGKLKIFEFPATKQVIPKLFNSQGWSLAS